MSSQSSDANTYWRLLSESISRQRTPRKQVQDCFTKDDFDPDYRPSGKKTLLMMAAIHGKDKIVSRLLSRGADPNIVLSDGTTALTLAIENNHKEVVEALLKDPRCDKDFHTPKKNTALLIAIDNERYDIATVLVRAGCDLNIATRLDEMTPLILALDKAKLKYSELMRILTECGCDVEKIKQVSEDDDVSKFDEAGWCDKEKMRAQGDNVQLLFGALKNLSEFAKFLIESGCDVNRTTRKGDTALHIACRSGDNDVVKSLINHRAMLDVHNQEGVSPLTLAIDGNHGKIVHSLLEGGADPELRNNGSSELIS